MLGLSEGRERIGGTAGPRRGVPVGCLAVQLELSFGVPSHMDWRSVFWLITVVLSLRRRT